MSRLLLVTIALCAALAMTTPAVAQRGVGEAEGIVRQGLQPPAVALVGVIEEVLIGPCHRTTGRAAVGAHALVRTEAHGTVNLHLGPAAALDALIDRLTVGMTVEVQAFRTDPMPDDALVARTVTVGDETFELRDDALRPHWAIGPGGGTRQGLGRGPGQGGAGPGAGIGSGSGPGAGPCWW